MTVPNPFKPYPKTRGPAKIFMFGDAGTKKTRRAMGEMPHPIAIIDMEGGACDYQDLADADKGDIYLSTRSVAELEKALTWVEANPDKVATLIVDPITVVWQQLQQGHIARVLKRGWIRLDSAKINISEPEEVLFQVADWNKLTTHHNAIVTRLLNLPCHVVAIARGMEKVDEKGNSKGYGWDGQKSLEFLFKIVIETRTKGDVVRKDRFTNQFADGTKVPRVDLGVFVKAAGKGGIQLQREDAAADQDASDETTSKLGQPVGDGGPRGDAPTGPKAGSSPAPGATSKEREELTAAVIAVACKLGAKILNDEELDTLERAFFGGRVEAGKPGMIPDAKVSEALPKFRAPSEKLLDWAKSKLKNTGLIQAA